MIPGRKARYWLACVGAILLGCIGWVVYRNYHAVLLEFEPSPADASVAPGSISDPHHIVLTTRDGVHIAGWYHPAKNHAAIVVLHGSNSDHVSMSAEISTLEQHGFGVLAIDWPGDGLSEGAVHWDTGERDALIAAIDWLSSRDEVDRHAIGALGFSLGSYVLAQVAASDTRLQAVVLEATPPDYLEYTRWSHHRWGPVSEFGASLGIWKSGIDVNKMRPVDVVKQIAPRKLLIIGGSNDPIVPVFMTQELYDAARQPVSLWIVEGAQHGGYADVSPEYGDRITRFFAEALLH